MHMLSGKIGTRLWSIPLKPFIDEHGIAKVWRVQDPSSSIVLFSLWDYHLPMNPYVIGGPPRFDDDSVEEFK